MALVSGRSGAIYKDLFMVLTQHANHLRLQLCPSQITTDFESAMISAVVDEVSSYGLFHQQYVSDFQFPNAYRDNEEAHSKVRKLTPLPLIPLNKIEQSFEEVV